MSECYMMDKGYDSEKIHALIRKKIKADSIIPLRERKRKKSEENIENNCIWSLTDSVPKSSDF